jgi:hypothetical protein
MDNGGDYQVTNADRTSIIDGLKHEISIRNSSPRTLRLYSNQKGQKKSSGFLIDSEGPMVSASMPGALWDILQRSV